ncbi:hypothetical protein D5S17_13920 [Pseudonocardiaceae bacterium YIM PH 21723]|nr:hypothetical protein D5S17_13920 [Pseudonocardiaceae bacterium YIM PH 21723]
MDALEILRVLRRQWVMTAALLCLVASALVGIAFLVPQQYKVTAVALVIRQSGTDGENPYGAVDKAQGQMASLAVRVLTAPKTIQDLKSKGADAEFETSNEGGTLDSDSPFLTVAATGASPKSVQRTAEVVLQRARDELQSRQDGAGVPPRQQLVFTTILKPDNITTTRAAQLRSVGIFGALGLIIMVLVVVIYDRAKQRKEQQSQPPRVAHPVAARRIPGVTETGQFPAIKEGLRERSGPDQPLIPRVNPPAPAQYNGGPQTVVPPLAPRQQPPAPAATAASGTDNGATARKIPVNKAARGEDYPTIRFPRIMWDETLQQPAKEADEASSTGESPAGDAQQPSDSGGTAR